MEEIIIKVKGKEYKVRVEEKGGKVKVYCGNDVYEIDSKSEIEPLFADIIKEEENEKGQIAVKAPLPGVIFSVNAKAGDKVKKGAVLAYSRYIINGRKIQVEFQVRNEMIVHPAVKDDKLFKVSSICLPVIFSLPERGVFLTAAKPLGAWWWNIFLIKQAS